MKTEHLHELYCDELIERLENDLGLELTDDQKRELRCYNDRTWLYAHNRDKKKSSLVWRLTLPLYFMFGILTTFVIQPTKWLFTGRFYFDTRDRLYRFWNAWYQKIGI
jgi:hypothetical protein